MLVSMKEMLDDAKRNHYAIPAFDVSNYEMMKAVLEACEEERSPALLMALGVDEETAYSDSCKIEHHISDTSVQKIKEYFDKKQS